MTGGPGQNQVYGRRAAPRQHGLGLGVAAALTLGLVLALWPGWPAPGASLIAPAAAASSLFFRVWRRRREHPLRIAWLLLGLGLGISSLSAILLSLAQLGLWAATAPMQCLTILTFVVYMASLGVRVRRLAGDGLSLAALLDAATITLVTATLSLEVFFVPATTGNPRLLIELIGPPIAGLGMALVTLYLVYQSPVRQRAAPLLLALAAVLTTSAEWLWSLRTLGTATTPLSLAVILQLLALAIVSGVAIVDAREADEPGTKAGDHAPPLVLLALPYLLLALLTIHVVTERLTGSSDTLAQLWSEWTLGICVFLVLARQWLMLLTNTRLLRALAEARDRADREARMDMVTGLPNKRLLDEYLATILASHRRSGLPLTILFADLDFFKSVNDRYGHAASDIVLAAVGIRLRQAVRDGDVVARYGGEKFVVLLPNTGEHGGLLVAERIRETVGATPILLAGRKAISLTISIGVAASPAHGSLTAQLLQAASEALYAAKAAGRDRVVWASTLSLAESRALVGAD